jgi:hypothetical protein
MASAGQPAVCLASRFGGGTSDVDRARAVWVDGSGDVVLAGDFQGNLDIAGGTVSSTGNGAFVASLGKGWIRAIQWPETIYLASGVDGAGNVALAGAISGVPDPGDGGGPMLNQGCSAPVPLDSTKALALTLVDQAGNCKLAHAYAAKPSGVSIAFDGKGNLVLAGGFTGPLDFGCPDFNPVPTASSQIFVVKLDPSTGLCVPGSGRSFGSGGDAVATGVAVDSATGDIYLTGTFHGTLDLGTGASALDSMGQTDVFVARLGSPPNIWARRYHGGTPGTVAGVVKVPNGVVVTGTFGTSLDVGDGGLSSTGTSIFALAIDPQGNTLWAHSIAGDTVAAVTADATGATAYVGASGPDIVVTKLDPPGSTTLYRETITSADTHQGNAVAFGATGLYVAGTFAGSLQPPDAGALSSAGKGDVFLLELCP